MTTTTADPYFRSTRMAIDRRVITPTIVQEMKARGVAQVLIYMRTPLAAGIAASEKQLPKAIRRCFVSSPYSTSYAIRKANAPRTKKGQIALSDDAMDDVRIYENLGIVLGNVDPEGLQKLQEHEDVAAITGAPRISLIRPLPVLDLALAAEDVWGADALDIPRLWQEGLDGSGVIVGHLDSGLDAGHEALEDVLAAFTDTDDSGDAVPSDPFDADEDGHGTHTAGTIAGRTGGIGIAPGCKLASAVVIVESGDPVRRVLAGLNWVIGQGVRVINMSLGIREYHDDFELLIQTIRAKNILPVVAVGNEGPGTSRSPGNYETVLSVGAFNINKKIWPSSSSQSFPRDIDPLVPDLVAPGVAVVSARKGGGFTAKNGTSMAAPHVSGLAALLFQAKPDATAAQVESAILASCALPATLDADRANRGIPNAVRALQALTGMALSAPRSMTAARRRAHELRGRLAAAERPARPRRKRATKAGAKKRVASRRSSRSKR